jgi:hypothetical protein
MLLVNSTGTVIDDSALRAANPLVSFPAVLTNEMLEPFGYTVLQLVDAPAPSAFYSIDQGTPTESAGVWTQTWVRTPIALADAQAIQSQVLNDACAAAITGGFTSSALGSTYTYPSKIVDQQNLAASVLASILPGVEDGWTTQFWCANSDGVWAWTSHTAAQIQQVGIDGKKTIMAYQTQNAQLQAQLIASSVTTVDQVAAIVWTNPT